MMKKIFLFLVIVSMIFAQSEKLYMSLPIKKAYENETRSFNGSPGKNYWINFAQYKIKATIDPESKRLDGELSVRYVNNSPDTLKEIVMHLYPDLFKSGTIRDWTLPKEAVNEGVQIKRLSVDLKEHDVSSSNSSISRVTTNMKIKLDEPLNPKDELLIETDWSFQIPEIRPIRTGAYSDTSMFIAYWYPKIAVYDDIHGWDEITYAGTAEMYSSVAAFDVEITAPKNFIVWATGTLKNPEEVLNEKYLERYNKAKNTEEIVAIISEEDLHEDITKEDFSTWKYKAESSPDFAFALGKNYLWDASTVRIKDRSIFVDAGYKKESKNFREVANILREGVKFHSEEMPGIIFPYPAVSVFNGSGGMEFPMMINDGEAGTHASTVGLTLHELAHTYFPFYMGINEKRYAFMDEGWAVFSPIELQKRLGDEEPARRRYATQQRQLEQIVEVPPMTPSFLLKGSHYRVASYTRSGASLTALQDLLGEELFLKGMQTFMNEWKEKHPTPYDFFFTFNRVTGEDLTWFWNAWYFEFLTPDLDLVELVNEENNRYVKVKNNGGLPLSIVLTVYYDDNTEETIKVSPRVWQNGDEIVTVEINSEKEIVEVELGDELIPDIEYNTREILRSE